MRFLFILLASLLTQPALSAPTDPPKLVSTSPQFWAVNVNAAAQKKISLVFDQRLRGTLTDWIGADALSPPSDLQTTYSPDHMSCSIGVNLQPGKVYICGLNERGIPGVGFQNEKGASLPPTYLVFQTAGAVAPEDAPPRVKATNPAHGAVIDPNKVAAIVITFDAPMNTKKHGLHLFENDIEVDVSKAQFTYSTDGTTLTCPFKFKPAAQYRLELNSVKDIGFSRANRIPLWPVQIAFRTN